MLRGRLLVYIYVSVLSGVDIMVMWRWRKRGRRGKGEVRGRTVGERRTDIIRLRIHKRSSSSQSLLMNLSRLLSDIIRSPELDVRFFQVVFYTIPIANKNTSAQSSDKRERQ